MSLYIDGPRGTARLRASGRQASLPVAQALASLRSLSDGAGLDAVLDALAQPQRGS